MGPNLKFSAYFAGSAFVIATLTGALAGVAFGAILLRAVIGAIVFAGIGYGSYIVISARLPELLSESAATSSTAQADGYGQNVDIVVDDDGEEDELPAADEPDAAESAQAAGVEQAAETGTSQAHVDEDEPGDLEEVAEGVESPAGGGDELVEEVEEVAAAPTDSAASAKRESEDVDENSVDALPDIGGFAGDFESEGAEGAEVVEEDDSNGGFGGSSRAQSHGIEQDPEVIAKALQTVIKRDE
ncbi:MAG: hypothetical protein GVY14_10670 [Spirochaetes bacterium]|jgi:hypothetical protein|nr:hypothetical protein [Spirochaetota bacterium]